MELIKPNEGELTGKVIVYSKFKGDPDVPKDCEGCSIAPKDGKIYAMYATTDPTEFMHKTGAPKEGLDRLVDEVNDEIKKCEDLGVELKIFQVYATQFPVDSETELLYASEDVLNTGTFSNPIRCIQAVEMGVRYYLLLLEEQTSEKLGDSIYSKGDQQRNPKITYKDFEGKEIRDHVMQEYIIPMIDSIRYDDQIKFKKNRNNFMHFSAGSPFAQDTIDLCDQIERNAKNQSTDLIEARATKINAIHIEDYIVAAQKRDEIKRLEKK